VGQALADGEHLEVAQASKGMTVVLLWLCRPVESPASFEQPATHPQSTHRLKAAPTRFNHSSHPGRLLMLHAPSSSLAETLRIS